MVAKAMVKDTEFRILHSAITWGGHLGQLGLMRGVVLKFGSVVSLTCTDVAVVGSYESSYTKSRIRYFIKIVYQLGTRNQNSVMVSGIKIKKVI